MVRAKMVQRNNNIRICIRTRILTSVASKVEVLEQMKHPNIIKYTDTFLSRERRPNPNRNPYANPESGERPLTPSLNREI